MASPLGLGGRVILQCYDSKQQQLKNPDDTALVFWLQAEAARIRQSSFAAGSQKSEATFRKCLLTSFFFFCFFFLHFKVSPSYSPRKEIQLTRSLSFFFFYSSKFVYFISWLWWVFIALHGFYLVVESKGCSSLCRSGFSPRWLLLLQSTGSRLVGSGVWLWALECAGFSSCSTWAWSCSSRALENGLSSCGTWA